MHTQGQNPVKTYDAQWKVVDDLQAKGLQKSALDEVRKIYQLAKKENQGAQVIKAALNMTALQTENRENNQVSSIKELEAEMSASIEPVRSILNSLVAEQYYFYYQSLRWQLYNRTATTGYQKDDISTWGTDDFHNKITTLYLASIQNDAILKETKQEPFDAIITQGNTRALRPTLYDLLTHQALKYFSSDERELKKPSYAFEISSAAAFDPAADFIHRKFETRDSTSLEFFALQLYQKLIAFHINDPKPEALIDVDLQRLRYVNQKSVRDDKEELYLLALTHIAEQYQQSPAAAQAWYLLAAQYQERGELYTTSSDSAYRFEKVKAVQLCEKIIRENPETEGATNANNLLNTIRRKDLNITAENVIIPDKPSLVYIEFKNFTRLYLRLIKATREIKKDHEKENIYEAWPKWIQATAVRAWQQNLPDTQDHQLHSVEIKIDALPPGEYMLLVSSNPYFSQKDAVVGSKLMYVSNISYTQMENDVFILHRDSGQPLANAQVRMWYNKYDPKSRSYKNEKGELYVADANGHFKIKPGADAKNISAESFEITYNQDRLFIEDPSDSHYGTEPVAEEADTTAIYLFTDRGIYRPGQTVYYKGIARQGNTVLRDQTQKIEIVLQNANSEVVDKTTKTVNEYGSFSGSFVLPQGVLNGQFSIEADDEFSVGFHVEEYKRPRFSVQFDTLQTSYKLYDTVKAAGTATAYAGNSIGGAKVSYRVVRNERILYPWHQRKGYYPAGSSMEIAHGETETDANGKFALSFEAIPNKRTNKRLDPIFDYTISADVTDTNGETRSTQTTLSVGYSSILIRSDLPDRVAADSLSSLAVRTENMNGEIIESDITVKLSRLVPEKRLIRPRYWSNPDVFVMTKDEFISHFPHDEYDRESEMENWPATSVFEQSKSIFKHQKFELPKQQFSPGFYKVEISAKNESDEIVKDEKYMELTDSKNADLLHPEYLRITNSKPIEPGETATVKVATSAGQVFMIGMTGKTPEHGKFSFLNVGAETKEIPFAATEADRGGYNVSYVFVKHNRIHQNSTVIEVPWANKELNIEYLTFRDKTLPGSKEQWKIKISGHQKDKAAAELLASMYDASLDHFYLHQWSKPDIWPNASWLPRWGGGYSFYNIDGQTANFSIILYKNVDKQYDQLISNHFPRAGGRNRGVFKKNVTGNATRLERDQDGVSHMAAASLEEVQQVTTPGIPEPVFAYHDRMEESPEQAEKAPEAGIVVRKNFNETAFFYPDLKTDEDGSITFSFTLPEALTRWKFQALAHTKELALGYSSKEIVTQKELMVQPNAPRFLREGDRLTFPAKVVNLSARELSGTVSFQLFDTETNQRVDDLFKNNGADQPFKIIPGQSVTLGFPIDIPQNFSKTLTWRIVAKAENLSDGEENILPVLSNRMLVTESMPISTRCAGNKNFRFEKLLASGKSKTLTNKSLTVEYTSNPAWYAVQSLPYLMEYPYECAEQTWNRYYANSLAAHIAGSSPKIAKIFENWRTADTSALLSNLQKNQELKSVLLEETPWVLAAKSEAQQKQNVAMLFDLARLQGELTSQLDKLTQLQSTNGGFVWFKGGPDDRYMTQYIVSGIGHLKKANAIQKGQDDPINAILKKAIPYLDKRIREEYDRLVKSKTDLKKYTPGPIELHYLYMRSFFPELPIPAASLTAVQYFKDRAKRTWVSQSKYLQGLAALTFHRENDKVVPNAILKSLKETAIVSEEMGMYWKASQRGWWWHESPIEQQALLIEAFQEIDNNPQTVNDLKTWLLKNKQTNNWESTKATAEACYALLLKGSDWLSQQPVTTISLGKTTINTAGESPEAGTGYFKKTIGADQLTADMGEIKLSVSDLERSPSGSGLPGWGAVYWQYFEDLDQISSEETQLKLSKKLFIEKNTDTGPVLSPVHEGDIVGIGTKIKVRIELRVDRDMEYVHMKDTRASGLEPVNVLSGFKWQDGLGYYESTKDASTNFFFSYLRKGTYVFEYPLFVAHEGDFSNGVTTIQCMYAPEFSAHSEGVRLKASPLK